MASIKTQLFQVRVLPTMKKFWLFFLWLKYEKNIVHAADDHIYSWDTPALGSKPLKPI